jgi:hypothetical protein
MVIEMAEEKKNGAYKRTWVPKGYSVALKKDKAAAKKSSVAEKKASKITKVPSKYSAFAKDTKISLPKSGTRTASSTAGGRVTRITGKNSSGRTTITGSEGNLSYTSVAKRGMVPHKSISAKSKMKYGKR